MFVEEVGHLGITGSYVSVSQIDNRYANSFTISPPDSPFASVGLGVSGSQIAGLFIGMRYAIYTYAHREISTQRES